MFKECNYIKNLETDKAIERNKRQKKIVFL